MRATATGLLYDGVQRDEILLGDARELRRELHVDLFGRFHRGEVGLVGDRLEVDAVEHRGEHDVLHRHELGHVVHRLGRELEAQVVGGQALPLVGRDRAPDAAFAAVVGGERQLPAPEHVVEPLQVVERGVRGGHDVAAVVLPVVLREAVVLARRGDELPQARGPRARVGVRVEGALHDRQQRDLRGHAALLHFLHDVVQVAAAAVHEALDVIRAAGVPDLVLEHERRIERLQQEALADALPEVRIRQRDLRVVEGVGNGKGDSRGGLRGQGGGGCEHAGGNKRRHQRDPPRIPLQGHRLKRCFLWLFCMLRGWAAGVNRTRGRG